MKLHFKLFAAAAAALILGTPLLAQEQHGTASCPYHQASASAVSAALALLDEAGTQSGDEAKATLDQARRQLTEAQRHMGACKEMCDAKMGDHGSHGDPNGHDTAAGHAGHEPAPAPAATGHSGHGHATAATDHSSHTMATGHSGHAATGHAHSMTDPVCGMEIDPKTAGAKTVYAGKSYSFCSLEDKEKFANDPEKYLKKQG